MNYLTSITKWNGKIHIYLGLYMLLFLWLFAVSGLFMNHPGWFGGQPNRTPSEMEIVMPESGTRLEKAHDIMDQLGLVGEVLFLREPKPGQFGFVVMRPNRRYFVTVTLKTGMVKLMHVEPKYPVVGSLYGLHVFTGMRGEQVRDWLPTRIWSFSMDALSVGLIALALSSLYMGWQSKGHRIGVLVAFGLGVVVFAFFMWGLAWMA